MTIKIIYILKKKKLVKNQLNHSIPNFDHYDASKKTIVFINGSMPTHDRDSGSNRLKEIILNFKEEGFNCIICTENVRQDRSSQTPTEQ